MQKRYKDFLENSLIKTIKDNKKWTISTSTKMPIDINYLKETSFVKGAYSISKNPHNTVDFVFSTIPNPANLTYLLNAKTDKFMVLDIEPSCPKHIKNQLLNSNFIYGEVSASKKGYHLVFAVPNNIDPKVLELVRIKNDKKTLEILINHNIMFTLNQIPLAKNPKIKLENILKGLTEKKELIPKLSQKIEISNNRPALPNAEELTKYITLEPYRKKPSDFSNDYSAYEFGYASSCINKLNNLLKIAKFKDLKYTDEQKTYLIYDILSQKLPYRDKHNQIRDNKPWLIYVISSVITRDRYKESR